MKVILESWEPKKLVVRGCELSGRQSVSELIKQLRAEMNVFWPKEKDLWEKTPKSKK